MTEPSTPPPPVVTGWRRVLYILLGLFFVGLAILGAILPVLPTTPFLILASYFFIRSSLRLHRMLLRSPVFGPLLIDWEHHRGVRPDVKVKAIAIVVLVLGASIAYGVIYRDWPWFVPWVIAAVGMIGIGVILRLPTVRPRGPAATDGHTTSSRFATAPAAADPRAETPDRTAETA
jgi:uncharacterized membrane protein YbaN (DUF454 family)